MKVKGSFPLNLECGVDASEAQKVRHLGSITRQLWLNGSGTSRHLWQAIPKGFSFLFFSLFIQSIVVANGVETF